MKHDVWTNIFYGISGLAVLLTAGGEMYQYVAFTFFLLMLGSAAFHGRWHKYGQAMDECAMYISFSAILASHIAYLPLVVGVCAAGWVAAALWYYADSFVVMPTLGTLIVAAIWLKGMGLMAFFLFLGLLIAVVIRHLGELRQSEALHGVWHLLTAVIMYFLVFPT